MHFDGRIKELIKYKNFHLYPNEIEEIIQSKNEKNKQETYEPKKRGLLSLLRVMTSKTFLRPFSCAGVLYLMAQLTGVSTMVLYMTNIFQDSGSSIDPRLAPVIVAGIRVVTAGLAAFVLRFASRRHLFVLSTVIIFSSTLTIATFSYMRTSDCCFDSSLKDSLGVVPLLAVIAMFIGHSLGVVPVVQLLAAEVGSSSHLKQLTLCLCKLGIPYRDSNPGQRALCCSGHCRQCNQLQGE